MECGCHTFHIACVHYFAANFSYHRIVGNLQRKCASRQTANEWPTLYSCKRFHFMRWRQMNAHPFVLIVKLFVFFFPIYLIYFHFKIMSASHTYVQRNLLQITHEFSSFGNKFFDDYGRSNRKYFNQMIMWW